MSAAAIGPLALLRILTAFAVLTATAILVLTTSANERRSCARRHRPHLVECRYTIG